MNLTNEMVIIPKILSLGKDNNKEIIPELIETMKMSK